MHNRLRPLVYLDVTWHRLISGYQCFRSISWYTTTNISHITSWKSKGLNYTEEA